ncbi:MAG: hypothetical protein D6772_07820 [Bacteroidetes bacterium]|nr:MAG: hypothetical protein D6772_07820 [Bacteroidota bacterium]
MPTFPCPADRPEEEEAIVAEAKAEAVKEMPTRRIAPQEDHTPTEDTEDIPWNEVLKKLPKPQQLTAGELNDFSKWELWAEVSQEDLGHHRHTWQQYPKHRYTVQLTNTAGGAVVNASVQLVDPQGQILWRARTDAQGRAELWAYYCQESAPSLEGLRIQGSAAAYDFELLDVKAFQEGINFHTLPLACVSQAVVDVAFVVDATGSMSDEIYYLQAEILDVMQRAKDTLRGGDLRLGSLFYRDLSDTYLTRRHALSANIGSTVSFMQAQSAGGGGDGPEAVEAALETTLDHLNWRDHATTRLLFLVLDAPPHQAADNVKRMQAATLRAAAMGIQIIPVSCSGIAQSTEYLMRSMALATNGTYTFLTNHSGIGQKHLEPSTTSYEVEHLNDLLLRLLIARSRLKGCGNAPPNTEGVVHTQANTVPESWSFYPNPTAGPFTIESGGPDVVGFLLDSDGKLLQRFTVQGTFELDLSRYAAGQYWLKLDNQQAAQPIILNKM